MEEVTVVYFYMDMGASGRLRRRGPWQYGVEERNLQKRNCIIHVYSVKLPGLLQKRKPWKEKEKQEYLRGLPAPGEGREICYFYEAEAEAFLGRRMEPPSEEWLLFLLRYYEVNFDALLILEDRELETEAWVRRYAGGTRYIGILTADAGRYEELTEALWEEYGFLLEVTGEAKGLHLPKKGTLLVLAGTELYGMTPSLLPPDTFWLNAAAQTAAGRRICAAAEKVRYLDRRRFLKEILSKDCIFKKRKL